MDTIEIKEDRGSWWRRWRNEIISVFGSCILLAVFWFSWVYWLEAESPMAASSIVWLFVALTKLTIGNAFAWFMVSLTGYKTDEQEWKAWAVFMVCFMLASQA